MSFKAELQAVQNEAEALLLLATGLRVQGDDPRTLTAAELAGGIVFVTSHREEVLCGIKEALR